MFATHFPVDRLLWGFDDLIDALRTILGDLGPEDRHAQASRWSHLHPACLRAGLAAIRTARRCWGL